MPANTRTHVPFRTKMQYAGGSLGEGFISYAINAFALVYYTQAFGVSGTLTGAAFLLTLTIDAITDPWIGAWSDRFRSRWGRRHPFIFLSALPLAAAFYCIYMPPEVILNASEELWLWGYSKRECLLFAWLILFAALFKLFLTLYHVPHLALGSELSGDYIERSRVLRWNQLFFFWGSSALAFSFYQFFPDNAIAGEHDATPFVITVCSVAVLAIMLSAYFTRDQIKYLPQAKPDLPKFTLMQFFREFREALSNRNYLLLLGGLLFLSPLIGMREALHYQMSIHYWELPTSLVRWFGPLNIPIFLFAAIIVPALHERFEKGSSMLIAVSVSAFASATPVLCRSFYIFPENGSELLFPTLVVFNWLFYTGILVLGISVYSALGDIADEHELKTGRRMEGIFYSARTFFGKVSQGFGLFVGGIVIDVIEFPSHAVVGEVDSAVLFKMGLAEGPLATIPLIGAVICYGAYKLDKRRQLEVQRLVREREGSEAGNASELLPT